MVTLQRGGASPFLTIPNVTANPSTASVPITVLLICYLMVPPLPFPRGGRGARALSMRCARAKQLFQSVVTVLHVDELMD